MNTFKSAVLLSSLLFLTLAASGQTFKRTTYKTDSLDFGMGGTVTVVGAVNGSITVEGWQNAQLEIVAEILNESSSESNLNVMDSINGFILDEGFGHVTINTVAVNDKNALKRLGKKVSKDVATSPFRINYTIRVPRYTDLNVNGGTGDFLLSGVDGTLKINFGKTSARMSLVGGAVMATFGEGSVDVTIPSRAWRGRFADIQLSNGRLNLLLPPVFDAEVEASVIRNGTVSNNHPQLKPRARSSFTEKSVSGKIGNGGVQLRLTVGDGAITIGESTNPN